VGEHATRSLTNLSGLEARFQKGETKAPAVERQEDHAPGWTLTLHVTVGERAFQHTISGDVCIGRSDPEEGWAPDVDLSADDSVSRRHARIFSRKGRYWLQDLDSLNGTRHNGEWLLPEGEVLLLEGDEIALGETCRILVVDPEIGAEEPAITDLLLDFAGGAWETREAEGLGLELPASGGDLLDVALERGSAVGLITDQAN
jgi:hypothetical protein